METNKLTTGEFTSLPSGTLTFLFSDVEGSTRLWESYPNRMKRVMARHDELIENIVEIHQGSVVRPRGEGDSRFAVFNLATDAVMAAKDIQKQFLQEEWDIPERLRVRIALHTGQAERREGDYYGSAVNRCARLRSLAHGGQTLLTQATYGIVNENLPSDISLRNLGVYNLKDLKQPERIFQVVSPGIPSEFPSLRAASRSIENMPVLLTSFIGRQREITEVELLLEANRLLTISGPGGAGKTRLALQVVSELSDRNESRGWFIDLAPLSETSFVPQYILNAVGIQEEIGTSAQDTLAYFFQDKSGIIIFDNCEQVLTGVAQLAQELIKSTPAVKILATSREPLGVAGETVWCIPSLSTPNFEDELPIEELMEHEAVQLFVARATTVNPQFTITKNNMHSVAQICTTLDGIPLAIELAAARAKVLSVSEIAARLDHRLQFLVSNQNVAPRQKTLRNLIDWSYELLPLNERALLRRLSIFAGGWTLDAAEAVCSGNDIETFEVLDLLSHLVDKSLVMAEISDLTTRYRLLETIRKYAQERLEESGEIYSIADKHATYFTRMVEQSYTEIWGKNQAFWIEWLETEHDNLRAAMDWMAQEENALEIYLHLAGSLWRFWSVRGYISEGRSRLEAALRLNPNAPRGLRANGLRGAGKLALQQGDYIQALAMSMESLDLFRELGDLWGIGRQLEVLGEIAYHQGDYSQAVELHNESLSIRKSINDKEGIAVSLRQLGVIARDHGDTQKAKDLFEQSLELFRELDDRIFTAQTLNNLGLVEFTSCEYDQANKLLEEAAFLYRQVNDRLGLSDVLLNLATVAKDRGELKQARALCEQSLRLKKALGDKRGIAQTQAALGEVSVFQGNYIYASQLADQSLASFQDLGVKRGVMFCKGILAFSAHYQGDYELAISLAEEGLKISTEINAPRAIAYCTEILGLVACARNNLEEADRLLRKSLEIFEQVGDRRNIAITSINLARTKYRQGKIDDAQSFVDKSLSISRQLKVEWTQSLALEIMGLLHRKLGNHRQSLLLFQESLEIAFTQDNLQGIANCLGAIAGLAILANQPAEGLQLFAAAQNVREQIGAKMGHGDQEELDYYLNLAHQQLDKERIERAWTQGITIPLSQAIEIAREVSPAKTE